MSASKWPRFTFDVDVCFSGRGDTLRIVSFTAELSVLVHTCNWHIEEDNVALSFLNKFKTTDPQGLDSAKYLDKSGVIFQYQGEKKPKYMATRHILIRL